MHATAIAPADTFRSTGFLNLDTALGGGYPAGRVVEIFGPEDAGRLELAFHAIGHAQSLGGLCAIIDVDHGLDIARAKACGVEPGRLLVSQPGCAENAWAILEMLARSGDVGLAVVNSTANLVPRAVLSGDICDPDEIGRHIARVAGRGLRRLVPLLSTTGMTVIVIGGLRSSAGAGAVTITGRHTNALRFYASLRLDVRRVAPLRRDAQTIGHTATVAIMKSKHTLPPWERCEVGLIYGDQP